MKTKLITLLVGSVIPFLSGCTDQLRQEMVQNDQNINTEISHIQDKTMTFENRMEELSNLLIKMNDTMNSNDTQLAAKNTDLQNQISELKDMDSRLSALESRVDANDKDTAKKLKVLLNEVVNENQKIVKRIRTIEKQVYGAESSSSSEETTPAATMNTGSSSGGATEFIQHKVKPGENLWGIAKNYGVTMEDIAEANRMDSTSAIIRPGQSLNIPKK